MGRIGAVDAARGTAMLFVMLAHFSEACLATATGPTRQVLGRVTTIASPTFMTLSGLLLGILYATHRESFAVVRNRLVDRALFLLLVGHALIAVAFSFMGGGPALHRVFITDAIAVSLIAGSWVIQRLGPGARLALGGALVAGTWACFLAWPLEGESWRHELQLVLTGAHDPAHRHWNYSLVPWFGVYLMASALGERVGQRLSAGDPAGGMQLVRAAGVAALAVGGGVMVAHARLERLLEPSSGWDGRLIALADWDQKFPPGPAYLLPYAGLGLLGLAGLAALERRRAFAWGRRWAMRFGRHSLFLFILQYWVFYGPVRALHPPAPAWWPASFALIVAAMAAAVWAWEARDGGRLLTVGYGRRASRAG